MSKKTQREERRLTYRHLKAEEEAGEILRMGFGERKEETRSSEKEK